MELFDLHIRTSHKYRDGWQHLDSSEHAGTIKTTPGVKVAEGNDYDEGPTYVRYARLPARQTDLRTFAQAIHDTLGGSSCRHEYDCCGCPTFYTRVKRINSRTVQIKTRVTYNY